MKPKGLKRILAVTLASLILLCGAFIASVAFTGAMQISRASANRLPGDMDGDGKLTAADARIVLRIAVHLESVDDYMDIEPQEPDGRSIDVAFRVTDNGYFIAGESVAAISVTANADMENAKLTVTDAADDTVWQKELGTLKKGDPVQVEWDGSADNGAPAPSGAYTVNVVSGAANGKAEGLFFTNRNYYSGGNGSDAHPFLIGSKEDFENVSRFPRGHFRQISDIDYNYTAAKTAFTADGQFMGVYNGGGFTIKNILSDGPLFNYIGAAGAIYDLTVTDSSFSGRCALVNVNNGTVKNCSVTANVAHTDDVSFNCGVFCAENNGLILNCAAAGVASGARSSGWPEINVGGFAGKNSGRILSCTADVKVSSSIGPNGWAVSGGIAGYNENTGFIQNCEAKGALSVQKTSPDGYAEHFCGGIAAYNYGQVISCIYTGETDVNLVGEGPGAVIS